MQFITTSSITVSAVPVEPDPDWHDYANCLGVDPDLFFPERVSGASGRRSPVAPSPPEQIRPACPATSSCGSVAVMPGGPEWIIILIVVLVLFGGAQLPKLAKNLGKAQKEFKDGIGEANKPAETPVPPVAQGPVAPVAPAPPLVTPPSLDDPK